MVERGGKHRSFWGVVAGLLAVVVLVALVIGVSGLFATAGGCGGCNNSAAQSNLQTALTAAKTYYTNSGDTFRGLLYPRSSTTSAIQDIDTGLSYAPGWESTGPHVISASVGGDGSYLVLAAFAGLPSDCYGIIAIAQPRSPPVLQTFFFVIRHSSRATCNAQGIASTWSTSTFPHG
jgi:hypothetical protein